MTKKLYRTLVNVIHKGKTIARDNLVLLDLPEGKENKLIAASVLAVAAGPPLWVLPGWKRRAKQLAAIGVEAVPDFIAADALELGEKLGVRPATIETWQREAGHWLLPPE